jgi:hypothetical protein
LIASFSAPGHTNLRISVEKRVVQLNLELPLLARSCLPQAFKGSRDRTISTSPYGRPPAQA